ALASAGALSELAGHRYQARWDLLGQVAPTPLLQSDLFTEPSVAQTAPAEGEDVLEDYHSLGLTLGRHPMALVRERGLLSRTKRACELPDHPHKTPVEVCGLVTGRQRPGTATGVTFVTLEDETGNINVIVWANTARQQRKILLVSKVMQVFGVLERQGDVIHIIAHRLVNRTDWLGRLNVRSRDFH
ncbi:MAG: OB-fold nucleic acid binding domain-containing protein, partial [Natronospirillum sp.]